MEDPVLKKRKSVQFLYFISPLQRIGATNWINPQDLQSPICSTHILSSFIRNTLEMELMGYILTTNLFLLLESTIT